jgi:hypothetical protein
MTGNFPPTQASDFSPGLTIAVIPGGAPRSDYRDEMYEDRFQLTNRRLALLEDQVRRLSEAVGSNPIIFHDIMIGGRRRSFVV